jgi:5-methyltetrahydropteroyltriglutamate--homocysteine methyltransferase
MGRYLSTVTPGWEMVCDGPIAYVGHDMVKSDIENLRLALEEVDVTDAFIPCTAPRTFGPNQFYESETEYLYAIASALREEYKAIIDTGLIVQVDDPQLTAVLYNPDVPPDESRRAADEHVDLLNYAVEGLPRDRLRLHTCYGINHGPRVHEASMREVAEFMLRINVGAYSFEAANPRHQHEWRVWQDVTLPEDTIIIPGFLNHGTSYVEHPELIADGIVTYAQLVGRENVIAGADCGFGTHATLTPEVHPTIVWEKFRALVEGAQLATERLWA